MKKISTLLLLSSFLVSFSQNLSDGSILFTSIQSDGDKVFTFVVLEEVIGNQQIVFTDKPLDSLGNFIGSEGEVVWQAPEIGLLVGDVVAIVDTGDGWTNLGSIVSVSGNYNLSASGDQVIAFERFEVSGIDELSKEEEISFIAAINFGTGNSWITSGLPNGNQSYLPKGVTSVLSFNSHRDNGTFNCPTSIQTIAQLKASILGYDNWTASQDVIGLYCDSFEIDDVVGLDKSYKETELIVFPNPVKGTELFFNNELTTVKVYNSLGKNVQTVTNGRSVSVDGLEQGVYLLNSDQGTVKFIIE